MMDKADLFDAMYNLVNRLAKDPDTESPYQVEAALLLDRARSNHAEEPE